MSPEIYATNKRTDWRLAVSLTRYSRTNSSRVRLPTEPCARCVEVDTPAFEFDSRLFNRYEKVLVETLIATARVKLSTYAQYGRPSFM